MNAAARPFVNRSGEKDLKISVREYNCSNIASVNDCANRRTKGQISLKREEFCADERIFGDEARVFSC